MSRNVRTYSELITIKSFEERYEYLRLGGSVGRNTFGGSRILNQLLYRSPEWKKSRREVILRDNGYDLAHEDHLIMATIYIHHMNPITIEDVKLLRYCIFDPENLISTSFNTHEAIHYGDDDLIKKDFVARKPFDTCPWR